VALAATAMATPSAQAASTRAEYVATVDQVCTGFSPQFSELSRQAKKIGGKLDFVGTETDQQEKRRLNRVYRGLGRYVGRLAQVFDQMVGQLASVSAAPGDEAAAAQWIDGLRQFTALQAQSAPAWLHHKLGRVAALSQQSLTALNTGGAAVRDFGITVCLTHIDVPETTFS
jgi:hypothetical protein